MSCQPQNQPLAPPEETRPKQLLLTKAPVSVKSATALPTAQPIDEAAHAPALDLPAIPLADLSNTHTNEALRFVFPDPGPAPVSAWRPPLYPVPWGLTPYDHFYFTRPIPVDEVNWPTADYRYGGVFFEGSSHTGIDISAPLDTPVLAAGPGKITWAGYGLYSGAYNPEDPYGLAVVIRHDFGYQGNRLFTVYGHMSDIEVVKDQRVDTGDVIGIVGLTGLTTGPHLHFEVRIGDNRFFKTRNPELWLAPPQGWGVLVGRVMTTGGLLHPDHMVRVYNPDSGQYWNVKTYSKEAVNSDDYYRENMVLGDLPAGNYQIAMPYVGILYEQEIEIHPGRVSYFTFKGRKGFNLSLPPTPEPEVIFTGS